MSFKRHGAVVLLSLVAPSLAFTRIDDATMTGLLNDGGTGLAMSYSPVWNFGQPSNPGHSPPCYPTWTFGGSPDAPDIYDSSHQTPGVNGCRYPDVGCGCRNPGVPIDNIGPPFPIYYTYAMCSNSEVRVIYNLFYEKDGADWIVNTGHPYDWESVIVSIKRQFFYFSWSYYWSPSALFLGGHGTYQQQHWDNLYTLSIDDITQNRIFDNDKKSNDDHPKVYISWSKHAHFSQPMTFMSYPDEASEVGAQSLAVAYRSQEWWHYVESSYYIRSDESTEAGQALGNADWGGADSVPPVLHKRICTINPPPPHDELIAIPPQNDTTPLENGSLDRI